MQEVSDVERVIADLTEAQWKDLYLEHARGDRADVVPFPNEEIQRFTNNLKGVNSAKGAISILNTVMLCISEALAPLSSSKEMRILDYGCGWGRMTRLLPFYFNIDGITGVDVDERLINNANELLPFMKHLKITSMEALPFEDASFDIVFANSVFSHLSEKSVLFTLSELSRTLRTGGVLVISTLEAANMTTFYSNENQRDWITKLLGQQQEATSRLQREGFIWGDTGRWHEYGIAIIDDNWIAKTFEAVDIQYGGTKQGADSRVTQNYKFGVKGEKSWLKAY